MNRCLLYIAIFFLASCTNETKPIEAPKAKPIALQEKKVSPVAPSIDISTEELMGKFDPNKHIDFVLVEKKYTPKANMRLRKEAYKAFKEMHAAASLAGISLNILSSTRNFDYQKGIWERKWAKYKAIQNPTDRAKKILEYSSMPGTSRHHWGTDLDLNDFTNKSFQKGGENAKVYAWLVENAPRFGFCQPYTEKGIARPNGYNEERWHWSYLPLASVYLKAYAVQVQSSDIFGFKGAETAAEVQAIEHYVKGVACE